VVPGPRDEHHDGHRVRRRGLGDVHVEVETVLAASVDRDAVDCPTLPMSPKLGKLFKSVACLPSKYCSLANYVHFAFGFAFRVCISHALPGRFI
jgi:hypothetical protein